MDYIKKRATICMSFFLQRADALKVASNTTHSYAQPFIWDNKKGWRQIFRPRLRSLSTYIKENRIRRASGPVHSLIPLHT